MRGYLERANELHDDAQAVEARLDTLEAQVAREVETLERAVPGIGTTRRAR